MAHIGIATGLLTGRINSSFELASRLLKEGHEVTFLCQPSTQFKIEGNGFKCVPVSKITFDYNDPRRKKMESSWFRKLIFHIKYFKSHYSEGKKILKLAEHKLLLQNLNADLVLIDVEIHDLIFTAIELNIPVKLTTTWFSDTISLDSPSIRTAIMPGKGFNGTKTGIFLSWFKMRLKIRARVLLNQLTFKDYRRWIFKKYAQEIGFDRSGLLINTLPPLYSFTRLPIISMSMSELEFPHRFAKNVIYVGPMISEHRIGEKANPQVSDVVKNIFTIKNKENKKLIYCSVGSMATDGITFLKKVISAVSDNKSWVLIISLGPNLSYNDFADVPLNVHLFNWVPQLRIIAQSDCVVTHAGNNTMNECLHYGIPMVIYSGKRTDQDGSAARMAYHGLGLLGDRDGDSQVQIKNNIEKVLTDSTYKENMKRFHGIYQDYRVRPLTPLLFDFQKGN